MLAAFGVAKLMRFILLSVMVGFVNALAILIDSLERMTGIVPTARPSRRCAARRNRRRGPT